MLRLPLVGYVWCPVIVISGLPEESFPSVFSVGPGATDTPMFQASTLRGLTAEQRQALESSLPGGRLIEAREIADLCFYLCRDEARILRGAVIDASLGLGVCPTVLS